MAKFFRDSAFNQQTFGAAGFDILAGALDETTFTGDWVSVAAVDNAVATGVSLLTTTGDSYTEDGTDTGAGLDIAKGQIIYGDFHTIKMEAGSGGRYLIAYRRALG